MSLNINRINNICLNVSIGISSKILNEIYSKAASNNAFPFIFKIKDTTFFFLNIFTLFLNYSMYVIESLSYYLCILDFKLITY